MSKSSPRRRAARSLIWLAVIVAALVGINLFGVLTGGGSWLPKLALDLQGGTQIILTPVITDGSTVTEDQLKQAVSIIRQRVDASGVSEAEINTQGANNVVVSIPGTPDEATLKRIEASAKLDFRPVLLASGPTNTFVGEDGNSTTVPSASTGLSTEPATTPTNGSDPAWITPALQAEYLAFNCATDAPNVSSSAPVHQPLITCDPDNTVKYLLGPVEVSGADIADASSGQVMTSQGASTGQWAVNIVFNAEGTAAFADVTTRLVALADAQKQFGIVLDGKVISAPTTQAAITDGKPQISGNFTQESAKTLADQLKYGALPIGFTVQSSDTISATLGSTQLMSGLLAGLIGLILVVVYSLIQYRMLGFVTVFSLGVAALLTYLIVTILSWREGYRLSLAGVAGLIVAIGITADSFIVYFERIRDELRDGRGLPSAVGQGWKRAWRTILVSDAVNLLAASVLFFLAVGNVRGFALTLGLTTIVDIAVVSLFTYPMLQLIGESNFFASGHKLSGLDPRALGATYRGRAQFRAAADAPATKVSSAHKEAVRRQTIAERKAAQQTDERGTRS